MKKRVIYVGHHQPVGERWVEESLVAALIKSGQCILPKEQIKVVREEKSSKEKVKKVEAED